MVFINASDSIWSYNLINHEFIKLVSTSTPVPGGTGDFIGFPVCDSSGETFLQLHQGTVLFFGQGPGAPGFCGGGFYSVPVTGGAISKVVDFSTTLPDGGTFYLPLNAASLDQGRVVISAQTQNPFDDGIWLVTSQGENLQRIVDFNTPYCYLPVVSGCDGSVYEFSGGFISGSDIVFGPAVGETGWNALFLTSISAPGATDPILNSNDTLPGDPAPSPAPTSQAYYYGPYVIDGNNSYFIATDPFFLGGATECGGAYWGAFKTTLSGGTMASVANTCDTLPGISQINSANSFEALAANEGTAIFQVDDAAAPDSGNSIYSSINGTLTPVIVSGQRVSDGIVSNVSQPGTYSINGGRVAFYTALTAQPYNAIYVASLACSANETPMVSVSLGPLNYNPPTKTYSQTVTVTNSGSTALTGPLSLVLAGLTTGATLSDRNGTTVCFAPVGSPYINLNLPANNELGVGKSTDAALLFKAPANTPITFTSRVAGPGAR